MAIAKCHILICTHTLIMWLWFGCLATYSHLGLVAKHPTMLAICSLLCQLSQKIKKAVGKIASCCPLQRGLLLVSATGWKNVLSVSTPHRAEPLREAVLRAKRLTAGGFQLYMELKTKGLPAWDFQPCTKLNPSNRQLFLLLKIFSFTYCGNPLADSSSIHNQECQEWLLNKANV